VVANLFGPDLGYVVVILLVVLVGGSQLPKIARNMGAAGKEFRKAQQEAEAEAESQARASAGREHAAQATAATSLPPSAPGATGQASGSEGSFRLSRAELDALLRAREEQVRREAGGTPG
jgi:TatA/E family protein of Tat protein translocase